MAPGSAADIRDEFDVAYAGTAWMLLVAPLLLSLVVEGALLLLQPVGVAFAALVARRNQARR